MLQNLHIENYALIQYLDIDFHEGFSVITGETGAGKSIILGALGLILGQRADSKVVKAESKRCIVEATFDLTNFQHLARFFQENDLEFDNAECIIRRELTDAGKSRAFINDTPVSLATLRELSQQLIDIHSQHQNLLLADESFQMDILDNLAANQKLKEEYIQSYQSLHAIDTKLAKFKEEIDQRKQQADFLKYQLQELIEAQLSDSEEQQELEQESTIIDNAEEIKQSFSMADTLLSADEEGILTKIYNCRNSLQDIQELYPTLKSLLERLENCSIELEDIAREISESSESINFDPYRQEYINNRLDTIYSLEKKHHCSNLKELIDCRNKLQKQVDEIDNSEDLLNDMLLEHAELEKETLALSKKLTNSRKEVVEKVKGTIIGHLLNLGMPNIQFEIRLTMQSKPTANGMDQVEFLFSANRNTPLQNISQIASGGEIARIMLSLKAMLSSASQPATIIFDEIDTGVSGRIAEKMAFMMQEMGNCRQVISITHLPQIASLGHHHYKVYKQDEDETTTTHICHLNNEERIMEIAHMLSGAETTEAAINNAKELLKQKT